MIEDNYAKAYKEITQILKYVPEESVNKIPKEMINMFESEMDKNYSFEIDITKPFEEQEILEETKAILANIFRAYWATDEQKARIIEKENLEREELERQKREKYNPDDVFKNKSINISNNQKIQKNLREENNQNLPVEIRKQNIFQKLLSFIQKLLQH